MSKTQSYSRAKVGWLSGRMIYSRLLKNSLIEPVRTPELFESPCDRNFAILSAMYEMTLALHNLFRWIALLLPVIILIRSAMTWLQKTGPGESDIKLVRANVVVYDVQFLIGLVLYIFLSPITAAAFRDFKAAMKAPDMRFFAVEHTALMIVAVAFAHLLKVIPARKEGARRSFLQMILSFILLLVLVVGIPWFRPLFP